MLYGYGPSITKSAPVQGDGAHGVSWCQQPPLLTQASRTSCVQAVPRQQAPTQGAQFTVNWYFAPHGTPPVSSGTTLNQYVPGSRQGVVADPGVQRGGCTYSIHVPGQPPAAPRT